MNLPSYFDEFISNIQPTSERIAAASTAHITLRKHLCSYEHLKYKITDSFLSGSYARFTAVDPIKDVDVILILEAKEISEDKKNPTPKEVLEDIKDAIEAFYDEVELREQRRSIQVNLEDDDICMDIVPAIAPDGKDSPLWVPDRKQGEWIRSHPAGHLAYTTKKNKDTNGQYVLVAKAFKWWKLHHLSDRLALKSFLLEAIVGLHISDQCPNTLDAFTRTIRAILAAYKDHFERSEVPSIPDPGLPENCLSVSCGWDVESFQHFYNQLEVLSSELSKAEAAETKEETVEIWKSLFADKFPDVPQDTSADRATLFKALAASAVNVLWSLKNHGQQKFAYRAMIQAHSEQRGEWISYESNGPNLPKRVKLRFKLTGTDVPMPYKVRWRVRNHGREATWAKVLHFCTPPGDEFEHPQATAYRGYHYMDCEIVKNGEVVALARHIVNIG